MQNDQVRKEIDLHARTAIKTESSTTDQLLNGTAVAGGTYNPAFCSWGHQEPAVVSISD
jgi:hypothetical protein